MISKLQSTEASLAASLDASSFPDAWKESTWLADIDSDRALVLGFYDDNGTLIGLADFHIAYDEAELYKIMVLPQHRSNGIAGQLINEAIRLFRDTIVATIFLEVAEKNLPARALYEKFGFTQIGFRADYYENPPDNALLMSLSLDSN